MSYVKQNLMAGEEIIHEAKLHCIVFLKAIIVILVGIVAMFVAPEAAIITVIAVPVGLLMVLGAFIESKTSEFAVTTKRVIVKKGLIRRESVELLLQKIEGVGVDQSILGRILNYGSIVVTGTGGSRDPFKTISSPLEFRKKAQEQISAIIS